MWLVVDRLSLHFEGRCRTILPSAHIHYNVTRLDLAQHIVIFTLNYLSHVWIIMYIDTLQLPEDDGKAGCYSTFYAKKL